jgi:hypothetical protein
MVEERQSEKYPNRCRGNYQQQLTPKGCHFKKMLLHSHFARTKLFCYKAIPIKLKNLRDSCCVEGYSVRQVRVRRTK